MAITSLVLGIVAFPGICCYGVPGIALGVTAVILGRMALRKVRASGGTLSGEGLAQAGWITGAVAGSVGLLYALFTVGIIIVGIVTSSSGLLPTPTP
jgi:hypothetical protein